MTAATNVEVVVVTGPVGVGKTSTVLQMEAVLAPLGKPHTLIDMDWLRMSYPQPSDDPFNVEFGYRNLGVVARNSIATGSTCIVIADVVETREQRERYRDAIPGAQVTIVRLTADLARIEARIAERAGADVDPWEARRAAELIAIMDANDVADLTIDTADVSPRGAAREIARRLGWVD